MGMDEARERMAHFIGYYNFQRTHQGIGGMVPADRYFEAAAAVRDALEERWRQNAKELALHGRAAEALVPDGPRRRRAGLAYTARATR